jgi:hypothetical protein
MALPQPAPHSHVFRTRPAAARAQHYHRVDVRGRPPFPLHVDCGQLDPGAVIRPVPGEWQPPMPERLDDEELADWRAGRDAAYQLGALTIGACLAVADA